MGCKKSIVQKKFPCYFQYPNGQSTYINTRICVQAYRQSNYCPQLIIQYLSETYFFKTKDLIVDHNRRVSQFDNYNYIIC